MFLVREPFLPEDAQVVADTIRTEDARELKSLGLAPLEAIQSSLARSRYAWTGTWKGVPVCVFGVVPISGNAARLWLLGSRRLDECKVAYMRTCRQKIKGILELYPVLVNAVDSRYGRALKWVERLGGEWVGEAKADDGTVFKIFVIRRKD